MSSNQPNHEHRPCCMNTGLASIWWATVVGVAEASAAELKRPLNNQTKNDMNMKTIGILSLLLVAVLAQAQLTVTVSPVKVTGQKAVVPLALKNNLGGNIESARAVVFLLDEHGKAVGQPTTRWVIGSLQTATSNTNGLAAGATNAFHFVITSDRPFTTTNLTAKVQFSRVVLAGGKVADVNKTVQIEAP